MISQQLMERDRVASGQLRGISGFLFTKYVLHGQAVLSDGQNTGGEASVTFRQVDPQMTGTLTGALRLPYGRTTDSRFLATGRQLDEGEKSLPSSLTIGLILSVPNAEGRRPNRMQQRMTQGGAGTGG